MDNNNNNKKNKQGKMKHKNVLEALKDVGSTTAKSVKKDLVSETSKDFVKELLGTQVRRKKASGEIMPGESLEVKDALTGKAKEDEKLRKQLAHERKLRNELESREAKKAEELKVQLHALQQEVAQLAESTQELGEETKVAAMKAPAEPGIYHLVFFEKLIEFIKSFRKRIEDASVWLQASNKRAEKKNFWARYKKHGGKFLLAADHYPSRSAG